MTEEPNRIQLIGYLEEALSPTEMVRIEENLRQWPQWREALAELLEELGSGDHSVATIWRRHRLTCPTRDRLGAYLAGGLVPAEADYIRFHLDVIECRWCLANVSDVTVQQQSIDDRPAESTSPRRRRFFESSIGYLPNDTP
jgi:hypothetical protein